MAYDEVGLYAKSRNLFAPKKRGEGFVSYADTVTFKKSAQQMLLNTLVFCSLILNTHHRLCGTVEFCKPHYWKFLSQYWNYY